MRSPRLSQALALLILIGLLGACAGPHPPPPTAPSALVLEYEEENAELQPIPSDRTVRDPFEGFNRGVYNFNAQFDRKVFLPALRGYRFITPRPVRRGIINFFSNLSELRNGMNGLLQARPEVMSRALMRFIVNSTVGVLGTIDVAQRMGIAQQNEDFGQTLGRWGVGPGPYLVLPLFGPSNIRDASGQGVDFVVGVTVPPLSTVNDFVYRSPAVYGPQALGERDKVNFRYYETGSPFEYDLIRFLFLKKRELDIAQ